MLYEVITALLIAGILIYFPHTGDMKAKLGAAEAKYGVAAQRTTKFKTVAWHQLNDAKKKVKANSIPVGKWLKSFSGKPHGCVITSYSIHYTKLYERVHLSIGTISGTIFRLEEKGLIESARSLADRRKALLSLTAEGRIRFADDLQISPTDA